MPISGRANSGKNNGSNFGDANRKLLELTSRYEATLLMLNWTAASRGFVSTIST
ncbi:hypothetical protein H6G89_15225 [Oscillatoria sp. FACHB-1407]|uniref:hypothetical protein n=1 Tax=Oscillatoria sp. FACHB-1407 TaxID=2692847 RepID=UPI0016869CF6|nr:hypothetical protein [Oscillatoria sp. FACHB-1407]MBD2462397.1 hypothetical protein [Oscillatoria sp. FACHB-1407]